MARVRILSIYDDGAKVNTPLIGGKGKSLLIDVDGEKTLFDTGLRGRYLLHNMDQLGVDADSVNRIVISHGSINHMGGLDSFLRKREESVDVYTESSSWECKRRFGTLLSPENSVKINMHDVQDWIQLSEHLFITPPVNQIANEVALVVKTSKGAIVISACAHGGIVDTLALVKEKFGRIHALIGGLHLNKVKQPVVNILAEELRENYGNPELYLNGCTTGEGIQKLRAAFTKDWVQDLFVGYELEFVL